MNVITISGIVLLCIALILKNKPPKITKQDNTSEPTIENFHEDSKVENYAEIINIEPKLNLEITPESDLENIKKELHEINNTLSFFKGLAEIIIILIIIKYIVIAAIITQTGDSILKILNTFKY